MIGARRFALDLLTAASVLGLAVVLTLWGRSYFLHDIIDSYHDVPAPQPGSLVPWEKRTAWRERTVLSFPGRFEYVSTYTTVHDRRFGPTSRPTSRPTFPASMGNGWWLDQRRTPEWRPSSAPLPTRLWLGFAWWQSDKTGDLHWPHNDYHEVRRVRVRGLAAPYWVPAVLLAALPGYRFARAWRRSRRGGAMRLRGGAWRLCVCLSVLFLVGTVLLWARSHSVWHMIERGTSGTGPPVDVGARKLWYANVTLFSKRGSLSLYGQRVHPGGDGPWTVRPPRYSLRYGSTDQIVFRPIGGRVWVDRFGFHFSHRSTSRSLAGSATPSDIGDWAVAVPHALPAAVFAALPAGAAARGVFRLRRRRRAARGLCARCGYDLRASAGRCPECGEPVAVEAPHV